MRAVALGSLVFVLLACNPLSGGSDGPGTATTTTPTSPGRDTGGDRSESATSGDGAHADTTGTCARYVTCIAKTSPSLLGTVSDTYGKSGSCWDEMSAGECEDACKLGLEQAGCSVCDPSSASCIGEPCKKNTDCADGELCSANTCIVDAHLKMCASTSCPSPYVCRSLDNSESPEMWRCVLRCDGSQGESVCPDGFICNGGACMNSDSLPDAP